jgi:hypothetical protein
VDLIHIPYKGIIELCFFKLQKWGDVECILSTQP